MCFEKRSLAHYLLATCILTLSPQHAGLAAQQQPDLSGQILNIGTRSPLAWVSVELRPAAGDAEPYTTITGTDGRFRFSNVATGRYRLSGSLEGYEPVAYGQRYPGGPGSELVIAADTEQKLEMVMAPTGVIAGRVLHPSGLPLVGAKISAGRITYKDGKKWVETVQATSSNDLGAYRLFSLSAGQYFVTAEPPPSEQLASITYPNARNPLEGTALDVRHGDELAPIDIRLGPPTPARSIKATAFDAGTGRPVVVDLWNFMGARVNTASVGKDTFQFDNAFPGSYALVAIAGTLTGRVSFDVGEADLVLSVPVGTKFDVPGRVLLEGSTAPDPRLSGVRISMDADSPLRGPTTNLRATVAADGTFLFKDVIPGKFRVAVAMPDIPNAWVRSIRMGTEDGLIERLNLDRAPRTSLEISIGIRAAILAGRVLPGDEQQPVAGMNVVLVPDGDLRTQPDFFKVTTSDSGGRFRFQGIRPGNYKVFAWENVAAGSWLVPEFLRTDEARGTSVRLVEGSQETVDVIGIPPR